MAHAAAALGWLRAWGRAGRFAGFALAAALSPATYTAATRDVVQRQIYFTAWQVFSGFTLFGAVFSLVVIQITLTAAREFGLAQYALELVFRTLMVELIPLLTALFVALRSGAAISSEIALMRVGGDFEAMKAQGVDPLARELVPRVVAAALSVVALTVASCLVAFVIAYLVRYGFSPWGFPEYTRAVAVVFAPAIVAGFTLKCLLFGVAVAVIPIAAGLDATQQVKSVPVAVLGGMVRLFFALGLIEVLSLTVKYV